jgi:hypothetical protein
MSTVFRDWAHPCHICAGTGLTPATSAQGLGLTPATSAQGLGLTPATSALGLGSPLPHLPRDRPGAPVGAAPPVRHIQRIAVRAGADQRQVKVAVATSAVAAHATRLQRAKHGARWRGNCGDGAPPDDTRWSASGRLGSRTTCTTAKPRTAARVQHALCVSCVCVSLCVCVCVRARACECVSLSVCLCVCVRVCVCVCV